MSIFKTYILIFVAGSCSCQSLLEDSSDKVVNLRDFIWKIDSEHIYDYRPDYHNGGIYFYRLFLVYEQESESTLEGEVKQIPYLLKGEFGEHPEGKLYLLPKYLNIIHCSFNEMKLIIEYGTETDPSIEIIDLKSL